jgi:DNA-binding response OmpR family regulator
MASGPSGSDPVGTDELPSILVVDDDPDFRHVIQWALQEDGWTVETAADGEQALEQARHRRPRLVVLDIGLPRLDGHEVAAGIRSVYGDTVPIVVVTADGHVVDKARRVGARAYLSKPFEIDDLCAAVHHALSPG